MLMSPIIIVCRILWDLERYIYKHCIASKSTCHCMIGTAELWHELYELTSFVVTTQLSDNWAADWRCPERCRHVTRPSLRGVVAAGHNWYLLTTMQFHGSRSHSVGVHCSAMTILGELCMYLQGSNELIQYKLTVMTMVHQLWTAATTLLCGHMCTCTWLI